MVILTGFFIYKKILDIYRNVSKIESVNFENQDENDKSDINTISEERPDLVDVYTYIKKNQWFMMGDFGQ